MTQFKDKAGKHKERASVGLYTYPVLQAADILVYKATHVPVGEDQKQHLELTRDIAAKFNHDFDAPGFFPLTEPVIEGPGARIMSPARRHGEDVEVRPVGRSRASTSPTTPTPSPRRSASAKTDPEPLPETVEGLEGRPEADNLVGIFAALAGQTKAEVLKTFGGQGFGQNFKPALADLVVARLGAGRAPRMRGLLADPAEIDRILAEGAEKARAIAEPILAETKRIVGFWPGKADWAVGASASTIPPLAGERFS